MQLIIDDYFIWKIVKFIVKDLGFKDFAWRTFVYYALNIGCILKGVLYHPFKQMTIYHINKPTDDQSKKVEIWP